MSKSYVSGRSYFTFHGGEVHCQVEDPDFKHTIFCQDYSAKGIMAVCLQNEIVRRRGSGIVELVLPYLPYARQDRVIGPNEPFSLKVFADIINLQNFSRVVVYDPHSDVGPGLLNNCDAIPQYNIAIKAIGDLVADKNVIFVSPDAGAYKKLSKLIVDDERIVIATKERGQLGEIKRTRLLNPENIPGKTVVIVDDICDGGRTFIELAKAIRAHVPKEIILYVTHGIFSNGFDELHSHLDAIITTNTIRQPERGLPAGFLTVKEIIGHLYT